MDDERLTALRQKCSDDDHVWQYWEDGVPVDPVTFKILGPKELLSYWPSGALEWRGCPICGKKQSLRKQWVDE